MVEQLNPLRVVMVDDDPDDIFITRFTCKRSSVPIDFIGLNSGQALYDHIKNRGIGSIDVILLDINMPKEDGYRVLEKLSAYPHIEDLKIVMFSTSGREHEKEMALKLGGSDFLEKPSHAMDVAKLVDLLASYHAQLQPALPVAATR